MRRRPGREEQMTERQVATANDTLNAFVGGRQKPWMTGAQQAAVRPRPSPKVGARAPIQATANSPSSVFPSPGAGDEPNPSTPIQTSPNSRRSVRPTTETAPLQTPQASSLTRPQLSINTGTAGNAQAGPRTQDLAQATGVIQQSDGPRLGTWPIPSPGPASVMQPQVQNQSSPASIKHDPSLANRIPIIDHYVETIGAQGILCRNLDVPRFRLLKNACQKEDFFYVVLHQAFCLGSFAPQVIDEKFPNCNNDTLVKGFQVLGLLIRGNESLNPLNLKWFSNFPGNFADFSKVSAPYRDAIPKVGKFLSKLASSWTIYDAECHLRKFPPLMDEMVNSLFLLSPVFQQVFFTAMRRNLNMRDNDIGFQAEKIYQKDFEVHQQFASRLNTDRPPAQKEIWAHNKELIAQYHIIQGLLPPPDSGISSLLIGSTGYSAVGNRQISNGNIYQVSSPSLSSVDSGVRFMNSPNLTNSGQSSPQLQHMAFQRSLSNGQAAFVPQSPQPQSPFIQNHAVQPGAWAVPILRSNTQHYPIQANPFPGGHQPVQGQMYVSNGQNSMIWNQPTHLSPVQLEQALQNSAAQQQQQQQQQQHQLHQLHQRHQQQQQQHQWHQQHQRQQQQIVQQHLNQMHSQAQVPVASFYPGQPPMSGRPPIPGRPSHRGNVANQPQPISSYPTQTDDMGNFANQPRLSSNQAQFDMQSAFIPRLGVSFLPQAYLPDETALHQAHLKSPRLVPVNIASTSPNPNSLRCYQVIKSLAMGPIVLNIPTPLTKLYFEVSTSDISKLPEVVNDFTQNVTTGTIQFRLRCIELKVAKAPTEAEWVVADTKWPRSLFMGINGPDNPLELRYKAHHGKDMPINLTNYIRAHGSEHPNILHVSVRRLQNELPEKPYAIGVEVIQIMQHDQIVKRCLESQLIPAKETINKIKASLSGSTNDDDDFAIVASDLTIGLADPFMAKIFDIPARGKHCLHRECFDLETFLITRGSKPKTTGQPSMVDVWKCPICALDARPHNLVIDGFLVDVRKRLEEQKQLHFKAITVTSDGEWRPKPERQPSLKRREVRADSEGFRDIDDYDDEGGDEDPVPVAKKARLEVALASTSERQGSERMEPELIILDDSD